VSGGRGRIAIVVPTLDEEERIGPLLALLRGAREARVVVSDGGSADDTVAIAAAAGVAVVGGARGRAAQMNRGAAAGDEEFLLFLHADTVPPPGFDALIRAALGDPAVAAGAFAFATDSPRRSLRLIERLANWRARRLGVVFGDQGIFVRRAAFVAAGGFPDQPIMEDHEFLRRVRRAGRVALLPAAAVTSARRWHARGPWRTTLANFVVTWAYRLGVPPGPLARWYRRRLAR
jgi:rSAM/selenodomain-associated transferase 2